MAMNKKEQARLDDAIRDAEAAKALAWPNFERPVGVNGGYGNLIHGWTINTYDRGSVREVWQDCYTYGTKPEPDEYTSGSTSKPPVFPTESDAHLALYHDKAIECANVLADILRRHREAKAREQQEAR